MVITSRGTYLSSVTEVSDGGGWVAESRSKEIIITKSQNTEIEYKHSDSWFFKEIT